MAINLGFGKFEKIDVTVTDSTFNARKIFLQTLFEKKSSCFNGLFRLLDFEKLPEGIKESESISSGAMICYILSSLEENEPRNELAALLWVSPVFHLLNFVSQHEKLKENCWLSDPIAIQAISKFDLEQRIKTLIPNWSELKNIDYAQTFCRTIEDWAYDNDLSDEWFLEFVVIIFRKLFFLLKFDMFDLAKRMIKEKYTEHHYHFHFVMLFNEKIGQVVRDSIFEFCSPFDRMFLDIECDESEPFEYKWRDFRLPKVVWSPTLKTRESFEKDVYESLETYLLWLKEQKKIFYFRDSSELEEWVTRVDEYVKSHCDFVEKEISEGKNELEVNPLRVGVPSNLFISLRGNLITANWYPSKISRIEFIERIKSEFTSKILDVKKQLTSYESFTKTHFTEKLKTYCSEVEKRHKESGEYRDSRRKHSGNRHFEWLVDYQIFLRKSYSAIKKENKADLKTVREGIKTTAELIGLTLARPIRSGRPKGSKTTKLYVHTVRHTKV